MEVNKLQEDLFNLEKSINSLRALLNTFQHALKNSAISSPTSPTNTTASPCCLALLADSSSLLKAQTTKLSLLILNKPYSPREIYHIMRNLSQSILPALMSGYELCDPAQYTKCLQTRVRSVLSTMWREMHCVLNHIPTTESAIANVKSQEALSSTGVLWEQCDAITALAEGGLADCVMLQVGGYAGLLGDAIEELEEWDPNEDDDNEDSEDDEDKDEDKNTQDIHNLKSKKAPEDPGGDASLDKGMASLSLDSQLTQKSMVLRYFRLIRLLFPALKKRRIASFPNITKWTKSHDYPLKDLVSKLDMLESHAKTFTNEADEIVGALYDAESETVQARVETLSVEAHVCVSLMKLGWSGELDEFSAWSTKWEERLQQLDDDYRIESVRARQENGARNGLT